MANTFVTLDTIADRALAVAHEKLTFIGTVNTSYDEEFGKAGKKVGDTIRVRNPDQFTRRQGSRVMDVQQQNESTQNLAVSTQDGVDMEFNSAEMALSLDELTKRKIEPAMSVLCSGIEGDFIAAMTKATYNTVGTAGTVPGASSDLTVFGQARAKLNQYLAPKDMNRAIQLDSLTMASVVNGGKALFQDSKQIAEAFREGYYTRNAMADWYENERTWSMTNGSDVTGTTDAAALVTDGGSTVDIHTTVAVAAQVVGQVFTIAGVYACHPETKAAYPFLQQFTITAIGASTTTVSPAIFLGLSPTTAAKQNVCASDGTKLALSDFNSKTLTFVGSASTSYRMGLMYHKDAFAFATADLPLMDDAIKCVRKQHDGLSLRLWQASDIVNDRMLLRIDILYGWLAQRPAWATRIICN
jgi:hypothetical protein